MGTSTSREAGAAAPEPEQHNLRLRKEANYKELHTGVKTTCRSLRRRAQAVVTILVTAAFSPIRGIQSTTRSSQ
jgi:hypothetical protein